MTHFKYESLEERDKALEKEFPDEKACLAKLLDIRVRLKTLGFSDYMPDAPDNCEVIFHDSSGIFSATRVHNSSKDFFIHDGYETYLAQPLMWRPCKNG